MPTLRSLLSAAALAAALAAAPLVAARAQSPAQLYENALARFEKNDVAGAVIQLKNALQQDPRLLAAHVLLGRALLAEGDAVGAEGALSRAVGLGVNRSEVALPFAQALFAQGKFQAVLDRFPRRRRRRRSARRCSCCAGGRSSGSGTRERPSARSRMRSRPTGRSCPRCSPSRSCRCGRARGRRRRSSPRPPPPRHRRIRACGTSAARSRRTGATPRARSTATRGRSR